MGGMTTPRARELHKNPTTAEQTLWKHLRLRQIDGHKFRRQQPIGRYIVDFVCLEAKLIVELDGAQHAHQATYDSLRTEWLEGQGFKVLRFWNNHVLAEVEVVKEVILEALASEKEPPLCNRAHKLHIDRGHR